MKQTHLKKNRLFALSGTLILAALTMTACGVKGPPEPPLPSEASVKKITPPPTEASAEPSPIIFPVKEGKKKKDSTSKKKGP
jgi:predicted small lipoprotein YifL